MTSKLLAFVLLLSSFGMAQGVAGDPGVGEYVASGGGSPSITFVKDCGGFNGVSSSETFTTSAPLGCSFTNGDTIFVAINEFNSNSSNHITSVGGTGLTCTRDSATPAGANPPYNGADLNANYYWYRCVVGAGATSLAIVYTTSINHGSAAVEFSSSAPFVADYTSALYIKNAATTTWITDTLSPTAGKYELVLGFTFNYADNVAPTATAPWTGWGSAGGGAAGGSVGGYQIITSTSGTYAPTGSKTGGGVNFASSGITYKVN